MVENKDGQGISDKCVCRHTQKSLPYGGKGKVFTRVCLEGEHLCLLLTLFPSNNRAVSPQRQR